MKKVFGLFLLGILLRIIAVWFIGPVNGGLMELVSWGIIGALYGGVWNLGLSYLLGALSGMALWVMYETYHHGRVESVVTLSLFLSLAFASVWVINKMTADRKTPSTLS